MERQWPQSLIIIASIFLLSVPLWGNEKGGEKDEKVKMAAKATVSIDQAIKAATQKVSGKVIEAELEEEHDTTVWEVEVVTSEGKVKEVHIDATSGKVIDVEEEDGKED